MAQKRLLDDLLRWPEDPKAAEAVKRGSEPSRRLFTGWSPPRKNFAPARHKRERQVSRNGTPKREEET